MIDPNKKVSTLYRNLIIIFWIVFYIGSSDGVGTWDISYSPFLFQILSMRFPMGRGYYVFEWMVVLVSLYLIFKFRGQYVLKAKQFYFLLTLLAAILFILINPNNTDNIFELFLAQDSKFVILIPLFYASVLFLRDFRQAQFFALFFKYGIPITIVHCSISLFLYLIGQGPPFLGHQVTILHSDNLQMIGFLHVLLVLRLIKRYKTYDLVAALILLLTLILSFRRTEVYITLLVDALLIMVMTIKMRQFTLLLNLAKICVFFIVVMLVMDAAGSINVGSIFKRQLSIFASFDPDLENPEAYDSRHLEQAIEVSQAVLERGIFWGGGIQNSEIFLEGQSTRAHSNLAFTAAKYGIIISIYYVFMFLWFIKLFAKELIRSWPRREFNFINLYRLTMLAFLNLFFVGGWASGTSLFDYFAQPYIIFILWIALYYVHPQYMYAVLDLELSSSESYKLIQRSQNSNVQIAPVEANGQSSADSVDNSTNI